MQPFDRHPADAGALSGCGSDLLDQAATALSTAGLTQRAYAPAIDNWSGVCAPQVAAAQAPLDGQAQAVNGLLVWAGTVALYWAKQVGQFNDRVDEIVADLHSQGPHFGATGTDGDPPTADQINAARAMAVRVAKVRWWQAFHAYIGDGGDRVTSMLGQGPTPSNVRAVDEAGFGDALRAALARTFSPFGPLLPGVPLLPFLPVDLAGPNSAASAHAGFGGQDGALGFNAGAQTEANLVTLRRQFSDALSTTTVTARVGAHAGADAGITVGPNGYHAGANADAFIGADVNLQGTLGEGSGIEITPGLTGRAGFGGDAGANADAGPDGLHLDAHAGGSLGLGGSAHIDVDVDPVQVAKDIHDAPSTIDKIIDMFD